MAAPGPRFGIPETGLCRLSDTEPVKTKAENVRRRDSRRRTDLADKRVLFCTLFGLCLRKHEVCDDAENQSAGNCRKGDLAEGEGKTADTGNQDYGNNEEVAVFFEVNIFDHLKTGNGDEAVKSHADTAHDAARNGVYESDER